MAPPAIIGNLVASLKYELTRASAWFPSPTSKGFNTDSRHRLSIAKIVFLTEQIYTLFMQEIVASEQVTPKQRLFFHVLSALIKLAYRLKTPMSVAHTRDVLKRMMFRNNRIAKLMTRFGSRIFPERLVA